MKTNYSYIANTCWWDHYIFNNNLTNEQKNDKIVAILKENKCTDIKTELCYGWSNQPEVVVFKLPKDFNRIDNEKLYGDFINEFGSGYAYSIENKDWKKPKK